METATKPTNTQPTDKPQTPVEEPKVDETKAEKPKKTEPVIKESVALSTAKQKFLQQTRKAAQDYLVVVQTEFDAVEPGHPHYSGLKFAKIRAERVIFSCDELSRGQISR